MCTHTRTIKNRAKRFTEGVTKARLQVPCGKCDDCRAKLQQDWSVRTYAEIERYNKAGGKVIFATFTYSNRFHHTQMPKYNEWVNHLCQYDQIF